MCFVLKLTVNTRASTGLFHIILGKNTQAKYLLTKVIGYVKLHITQNNRLLFRESYPIYYLLTFIPPCFEKTILKACVFFFIHRSNRYRTKKTV